MRTDVKIGLIGVFAILLCVMIYFVAEGSGKQRDAYASPRNSPNANPSATPSPASPPVVSTITPPALSSGDSHPGPIVAYSGGTFSPPSGSGHPNSPSNVSTPSLNGGSPSGSTPLIPPRSANPSAGNGSGSPSTPSAAGSPSNNGFGSNNSSGQSSGLAGSGSPSSGGTGAPQSSIVIDNFSVPSNGSAGSRVPMPGSSARGGSPRGSGSPGSSSDSQSIASGPSGSATTYSIEQGDNFSTLAKKFGVSVAAIQSANPGVDSTKLQIKQKINIPAAGTGLASHSGSSSRSGPNTSTASNSGSNSGSGSGSSSGSNTAVASSTPKPGNEYKVQKGDNLTKIAKEAYGSSSNSQIEKIYDANKDVLSSADDLPLGALIKLPSH